MEKGWVGEVCPVAGAGVAERGRTVPRRSKKTLRLEGLEREVVSRVAGVVGVRGAAPACRVRGGPPAGVLRGRVRALGHEPLDHVHVCQCGSMVQRRGPVALLGGRVNPVPQHPALDLAQIALWRRGDGGMR